MAKGEKKEARLYDDDGRWVEERGRIKGALRRTFRLHPAMKEVLTAARIELPPALKKDGEPGKKNQVRYRCALCKNLFSQKYVQVDHLEPAVKLYIKESEMSYDDLVRGIFCKKENLQVLCSTPIKFLPKGQQSCHRVKTNEENFIRDKWQDHFGKHPHNVKACGLPVDFILKMEGEWKKEYENHLLEKKKKLEEKEQRKLNKKNKKQNLEQHGNPKQTHK